MEFLEFKSKINEVKDLLEGLKSRFELAEERISRLENRPIETI